MRRFIPAILFLVVVGINAASAQTTDERRWTVGGTVGDGRTWDDEGSIGHGWLVGAYVDRRLRKKVHLEVAVDVLRNKRSDAFVAEGTTTYISTALVGRFGGQSAHGFVMGGGALAVYDGRTGFADGSFQTEHESVNPSVILGGGLVFRAGRNVEIGPTVRMTLMRIESDSDPWSSITVGLRVGFGFQ